MPKSSMKLLIEMATEQLQQQQQQLQRLNSERNQATTQLSALQQYRYDYSERLQQTSQQGLTVSNYHNFYRFIGTLDQAIEQQNTVLGQLDRKVSQQQQNWLSAKQRLNAYQALQDRRDNEHAQQLMRAEQRQNDELSAAMHYRLKHAN